MDIVTGGGHFRWENSTASAYRAYTAAVQTIETTTLMEAPPLSSTRGNATRLRWRPMLQRIAFWAIIGVIGFSAALAGLLLRHWAWDQTEDIRFVSDINNAFRQGTASLQEGYLDRYIHQDAQHVDDGNYDMDYAPGRLLIATLWVKHVRTLADGPVADWRTVEAWPAFYETSRERRQSYVWLRPLLEINIIGELTAAVGIFFLVRRWTGRKSWRTRVGPSGSTFRIPFTSIVCAADRAGVKGAVLGMVAALFFWFNLELIWNAHCWPQWDSWLLPFFVWALVAASEEWWFVAGMLIAAGMMFKAQILFGAPVLILWPLWRGKLLAIAKFLAGAAVTTAAITAGWLVRGDGMTNHSAVGWVAGAAAALVLIGLALRMRWKWFIRLPMAIAAVALVWWPFVHMTWGWTASVLMGLIVAGVLIRLLPWRELGYVAAVWMATALFLCVPVFGGTMSWFRIGIAFGTHHFLTMTRGPTNNLAAILGENYHWEVMDPAMTIGKGKKADRIGEALKAVDPRFDFTPGEDVQIPLKYVCFCVYAIGLLLCSVGMAIHSSRGSPRFLVAVVAPWVLFFAVNLQMHERYLLWGATLSAMTVAISPGFALLHLLITFIGWSQEALNMARHVDQDGGSYHVIMGWTPGMGWALMLCAAIYLYVGVMPERKRKG